jgi:hypothetical protein
MPGATEGTHMGHPDFRVGGRVFASLGAPRPGSGMVKLSPDEQELFVKAHPKVFAPMNGAWGRSGYTRIELKAARVGAVREALTLACRANAERPRRSRR